MTFHAETITRLSGSLQKYSVELEEARDKLAAAQLKVDEKTAIVADCVRFLDFAELCDRNADLAQAFADAVLFRDGETAATDRPRTYTEAQIGGEACVNCGRPFRTDERYRSTGQHWDAYPLFAHNTCPVAEGGAL